MTSTEELREAHYKKIEKETAELEELGRQVPYGTLPLRYEQARGAVSKLKGLPVEEQIKGIQAIPYWLIQGPGVENSEINAVLEFLGCTKRAGYAHGYSSSRGHRSSSWGYLDVTKPNGDFVHSFKECKKPPTSIDAITFLLSL